MTPSHPEPTEPLRIAPTYQPHSVEGAITRAEGWIARVQRGDSCCGAFFGRTRKSAYMRAYRFLKSLTNEVTP